MSDLDLTGVSLQQIINSILKAQDAQTRLSSDLRPRMAMRVTVDLTTAATAQNPMVIANPFNGVYVESATDTSTTVQLSFVALDKYATDNYTSLKQNDSFKSDKEIKNAVLTWSAQASKSITLVFYLGIDFRPGSQLSTFAGGVSIIDGSSLSSAAIGSAGSSATVSVTTSATQVCPSDTSRKRIDFYVPGAVWIGDGAVERGLRGIYFPGGIYSWRNTTSLYMISVAGTLTVTGNVQS